MLASEARGPDHSVVVRDLFGGQVINDAPTHASRVEEFVPTRNSKAISLSHDSRAIAWLRFDSSHRRRAHRAPAALSRRSFASYSDPLAGEAVR